MVHKVISFAMMVLTLSFFGCASERYTQNNKDYPMRRDTLRMMTQQDVMNMSKAGVSDSLIITTMDATDSWFKLKSQDVIDLRNAGVSEKVISAMMQQPEDASSQSGDTKVERYYVYPPYYWYDGFYPYWYYPRFSVNQGFHSRMGFHSFHRGRFH
jgi:hypothetical protein